MWVRGSPLVRIPSYAALFPHSGPQAQVTPPPGWDPGLGDSWAELAETEHPPLLGGLCPSYGIPKRNLAEVDFRLAGQLALGNAGHRTGSSVEQWVPQLRNEETNENHWTRCSPRER